MKRRAAALMAVFFLWSAPALAWDPFRDDGRYEPPAVEREPDPAPLIAPPPGIYYVTDTYVADGVTTTGALTTYWTSTVHESTGSYARVLDTVGTGASSAFDGSSFNRRLALGDGRAVAGTYYENYVLTTGGFVPVSVVFFQDDAELARTLSATPTPSVATPTPSAPLNGAVSRPFATTCCGAQPPAVTIGSSTPIPTKRIEPRISLLPLGAPLRTLEVLRGRAVALYPRAFVGDREVQVESWTVTAGDAGDALVTTGTGGVPFRTSWRRLAPPDAAFEVVFRIEVDTPETGHRSADVSLTVVVRAPALER